MLITIIIKPVFETAPRHQVRHVIKLYLNCRTLLLIFIRQIIQYKHKKLNNLRPTEWDTAEIVTRIP